MTNDLNNTYTNSRFTDAELHDANRMTDEHVDEAASLLVAALNRVTELEDQLADTTADLYQAQQNIDLLSKSNDDLKRAVSRTQAEADRLLRECERLQTRLFMNEV